MGPLYDDVALCGGARGGVLAMSATHDFSYSMGYQCCISRVIDEGQQLRLYGWTDKPVSAGDFVILAHGDATSRYKLTSVERPGDPTDQWFADAVFAPRPAPLSSPRNDTQ